MTQLAMPGNMDIEDLGFTELTPRRKPPFDAEIYDRAKQHPLLVLNDRCKKESFQSADLLPDDVLGVVFSFVGVRTLCVGCMRSCKRWFVASMESNLWTSMFLTDFGDDAEGHNLKLVKNFKKRHFYLIYKRATKQKATYQYTGPEVDEYFPYSSSGFQLRWRYRCPLSWFDLDPISATERRCSACGKNVKKLTVEQLRTMKAPPPCTLLVSVGVEVGYVDEEEDSEMGDIELLSESD
eukprot:TRINITY_DN66922_c3_g3_i3.p1 TRINITY_DN66922_c3_g3~~TRINITY_DN66922_c3_g3_i3.p1  ORF type:complete len:238 (+),score=39.82 TRINITY_DN66922_c3_g3_i3:94-807(+)